MTLDPSPTMSVPDKQVSDVSDEMDNEMIDNDPLDITNEADSAAEEDSQEIIETQMNAERAEEGEFSDDDEDDDVKNDSEEDIDDNDHNDSQVILKSL